MKILATITTLVTFAAWPYVIYLAANFQGPRMSPHPLCAPPALIYLLIAGVIGDAIYKRLGS